MIQAGNGSPGRRAGMLRVLRFLVGGGLNTAVTYLVYLALHAVLSYQLAFFIAYAAGIVFSYFFNSTVVFKRRMSWHGMVVFPLVYLVQYGVSALVLGLLVEHTALPSWIAPLLVSVITLPLTFVLTRLVVNRFNPPVGMHHGSKN
ncbi:GtrA family protein [Massilia brevitalea]|uniref:GtrA family protein n=1 Tax=Massilia brevitalea TaxID=442526 RepID=UPI002739F64C